MSATLVRLLFDEQLSHRLPALVADLFLDSLQVVLLGEGGASDRTVWRLAIEHRCLLVTKDEDFHRMSVLLGSPPQVIWIRLGNCSTQEVADLLRRNEAVMREFSRQDDLTFLALG